MQIPNVFHVNLEQIKLFLHVSPQKKAAMCSHTATFVEIPVEFLTLLAVTLIGRTHRTLMISFAHHMSSLFQKKLLN